MLLLLTRPRYHHCCCCLRCLRGHARRDTIAANGAATRKISREEDMTEAQQAKLRQTRKTSQARRGQLPRKVELISVFMCDGSRTKPCGEFVYLGTQIDPTCPATPEVRQRCGIACAVLDSLSTLWRSSSIATDVNGRLYCALVLSMMCYNAEVYGQSLTLTLYISKAYISAYSCYCVAKTPEEHLTRDRVLRLTEVVPQLLALLRQKRLRWVRRALRRAPTDRSRLNRSRCRVGPRNHVLDGIKIGRI